MRIGVPELILILVIIVVVLGPGRLPQLGRAFGQTVRAYRQGRGMDAGPAPSVKATGGGGETQVTGAAGSGIAGKMVSGCLRLARWLLKRGGRAA